MKKLFMVAIILMVGVGAAMAQKDVKAIGLNLNYGSEISNLGIGAKFQYGLTDAIREEASFNYFLEKDGLKMWDVNANFHYLFDITETIKVYPLAGLTYANCSIGSDGPFAYSDYNGNGSWDEDTEPAYDAGGNPYDGSSSSSESEGKFGVNIGVGAEYQLNEKWSVGAELKYQIISDFNQVVFGVGVAYKF